MEFQPVVDLRTDDVVALEALARGPHGSSFKSPRALFAAARAVGRVAELDWVCRVAAFAALIEDAGPRAGDGRQPAPYQRPSRVARPALRARGVV